MLFEQKLKPAAKTLPVLHITSEVITLQWKIGEVKPMEPQRYPEPFDSKDHLFEIKWDGMRLLAFIKGEVVRLQNRNLQERTTLFPELAALFQSFYSQEAIIDGELIALEDGKPSFPLLMKRAAGSPSTAAARAAQIPVIYIPFDILYLDGKNLTGTPLLQRKDILEKIFKGGPHCTLSPVFQENGRSLFETVKARELEGIVAKGKNTPYLLGKKSGYWLKIKNRRKIATVIGGYLSSSGYLNSILVGAFQNSYLHYLGRIGSGLKRAGPELPSILSSLTVDQSPFHPPPRINQKVYWVEPLLVAEVEYQEWTPTLKLRQPTLIKLLTQSAESCLLFPRNGKNNKPKRKQQ